MNYVNQIKSIILGLVLAVGISFAGATWTAPSASPTNNGTASAPIDTSASDQAKAGTLALASTSVATSPYKLDVIGYILSTGLAVSGGADVQGNIKSDTLASTGTKKVCADSTGVLGLCSGDTFSFIYTSDGNLVIPSNISSMTVELWGGGGASQSRITGNSDGGDTSFNDYGTKIIAGGGKKGTSSGGGAGGTYTAPSDSKYTYITKTNGSSGTAGGTAGGMHLNDPIVCGSIYIGDTAGAGGAGGASGGVSGPSGGTVGSPGSITGISCGSNVIHGGSYGGSGTTPASYGVGGSGIGGTGGSSGDTYSGDPQLTGENGFSGGGGGAYIKVTISVTAGEYYSFTVGRGGQAYNTWPYGGFSPNSWPFAGMGGSGAIKITYTM